MGPEGLLGAAEAPGDGVLPGRAVARAEPEGAGVAGGRTGAVGQLASAGSKAAGVGVGLTAAAEALAELDGAGEREAPPVREGVGLALGDGTAVATYGVYEGHGGSGGTGGACAPVITSEAATATAPTSTVSTKVIAPHSRRNRFTRRAS